MKENGSRQDELTSIAYSVKKRKLQDERLEMPFPKQVCRNHHLDRDKFTERVESETESINSNSSHTNSAPDSFMSGGDEKKTDGEFLETHASDEASTSSASWAGTLYYSENTLAINSSTCETELLSINELQDCLDYQNMRHLVEFGSNAHAQIDCYTDKELENQLYSNGVVSGSSYILSSGRWSVDQGAEAEEEGKKKLTIDKEFEQHFSMLML